MTKTLNPDHPVFESKGDDDNGRAAVLDVRDLDAPLLDRDGREYEFVGEFLEDDDFYQGLNKISLIRRKSDGRLYGYSWWDDISKHGESFVEPNGEEFGLECDYEVEGFDWDNDYVSYYVWVPVEPYPLTCWRPVDVHP